MKDLGLGRGIDATNAKPWANKSAFQVRPVTAISVLGTEEGGAFQSFTREVLSVVSQQAKIKACIDVPKAPVNIGVGAELSRSVSSTRKTVGKKVTTRSISFLGDFNNVPVLTIDSQPLRDGAQPLPDAAAKDDAVADVQHHSTFEQRLSGWIVWRILQQQELTAQDKAAGGPVGEPKFPIPRKPFDPIQILSDFVYSSNKKEKIDIIGYCYDFMKHFRITHYVSTIELGAMEYRVFSEDDFNSTFGSYGALGVEKVADLSLSQKRITRKFRMASDVRKIGKITNGKVRRGTHDEAVVGIKVQPIWTLVKFP
jgi:hypothetical protein